MFTHRPLPQSGKDFRKMGEIPKPAQIGQPWARRRFIKVTGGVIFGGLTVGLAACSQETTSGGASTATAGSTSSAAGAAATAVAGMPGITMMPGMTMDPNMTMPATSAAAGSATTPSATTAAPTATVSASVSQNTNGLTGNLFIPPLLEPQIQNGTKVFNLNLQKGQSQFVAGLTTPTLGINGNYLGPTIRATRNDQVLINVNNQIGEETTLHWHGLHVPPAMDGGPHQVIPNNATWSPRFTVQQNAATLWYHPHMMGLTRSQVLRGLVGMFILDDTNPAQNGLPHIYGVNDIPLIFQDETIGANGQIIPNGGGGGGRGGQTTTTLVNGSISPTFNTNQAQVRFRILNASDQRVFTFGFANNATFTQVASDGGLLPAPVSMTRLRLAPAERAEIVVNVSAAQPLQLQNFGGNGGGGRGGNGSAQAGTLLTIKSTAAAANQASLPAQLAIIERLQATQAVQTRIMVLAGNDNNPTINNQAMTSMADMMDMTRAIQVKLNTTEVWNIINRSGDTHAFHVHDIQFQILDRNNAAPAANEMGLKDTVMVSPRETVRIIMRFTDFADPNIPYMYHCHILEHEDNGMMGQFLVVQG